MTETRDNNESELFRRTMEAEGVHQQPYANRRREPDEVQTALAGRGHSQAESAPNSPPSRAVIDQTTDGPLVLYARSGLQKSLIKKLRQGALIIEESLDLHGMRSHQADAALNRFISEATQYGCRCVQIIHGKGQRSEQTGGVLKPLTIHWLKQQPEVLAFCSCTPQDGGSGATSVLLKSQP